MEKISGETPDLTQENIQKIAELFPDVVTESYNDEGNLVRSVDFDALKGDLTDHVVEGTRERYQFTWPGKAESKLEARRPTTKTMRPCPEKSVDWDTTQNLYIEGDNLEALKIMRETYAGKVKLIYIDPPYNTGHDFVYDDDFAQTKAEYDETSGDYDEEGGRLVANPESNGRFHSDWCSMMYPRLLLARDMLSEDGIIAISSDDKEQANLHEMCDEVFGMANFEGHIHWRRRSNQPNDPTKLIGLVAEHLLVYSKDDAALRISGVGKIDSSGKFRNPDSDPRGPWATKAWKTANGQSGTKYQITSPTGTVFQEEWMGEEATFKRLYQEGRILFPRNGDGLPRKKYYQSERVKEGQCATNWWSFEEYGSNQDASRALKSLMGASNVFSNPKPTQLIRGLVQLANTQDNDLVLDFFSGSASTAEAVFGINRDEQISSHFVLVQIPENLDESLQHSSGKQRQQIQFSIEYLDSICHPHLLTEIGEERIRRAGKKILAEVDESNRQLKLGEEPKSAPDVGFRVMRIDDSCIKDDHATPQATDQSSLDDLIDNSVEGATDLDLLFQVLPKFRIPYSASIEKRDIVGTSVYDVDDRKLLACFGKDVSTEAIEAIAKEKPVYAVFRDTSLADDSAAANLEELFKTFSPDTIRRAI